MSRRALVLGLIAVFLLGAGSASVLNSFGSISGTADVERPLEIAEVYYNSNVSSQDYGEYILLESNTGVDLSNWNLYSVGEDENINNVSERVSSKYIALVDNDSAVENIPEDTVVYNVGTINKSGLGDDETLSLNYIPSSAEIHSVDYDSDCSSSKAFNSSANDCEKAYLTISGGSR